MGIIEKMVAVINKDVSCYGKNIMYLQKLNVVKQHVQRFSLAELEFSVVWLCIVS